MGSDVTALTALQLRYSSLLDRIEIAERVADLADRFSSITSRLASLDFATAEAGKCSTSEATATESEAAATECARQTSVTPGASNTQQKLERELICKAFSLFSFVRVPDGYYDQPLEYRMGCLQAASIHHLCKSIILENTKAEAMPETFDSPHQSKYVLVVVQYAARLDVKKLKLLWHKLGGRKGGTSKYDFQLAPPDLSDKMSGFEHNAVTPVGIACPHIPIVLSHHIAQLKPELFWMGGGEVDLKLGVKSYEFVEKYKAIVANVTEDAEEGEEE